MSPFPPPRLSLRLLQPPKLEGKVNNGDTAARGFLHHARSVKDHLRRYIWGVYAQLPPTHTPVFQFPPNVIASPALTVVAQLVEQRIPNPQVGGSIPSDRAILNAPF